MTGMAMYVEPIRELAGRGLTDAEIAEEVGLVKRQVANLRFRFKIAAANPATPRKPKPNPVGPSPTIAPERPTGAWCVMLAEADRATYLRMRRAVCRVLGLDARASDEAMLHRVQLDRRTADELAGAYLAVYRSAAG